MSVYNASTISSAIRAVLVQTGEDWELIVAERRIDGRHRSAAAARSPATTAFTSRKSKTRALRAPATPRSDEHQVTTSASFDSDDLHMPSSLGLAAGELGAGEHQPLRPDEQWSSPVFVDI
jgi:hypothetical protein